MSYQALARKWRPKNFDEVVGQAHVVSALRNGLDNQRVHHAFLFTGTRGVGKTTLARIFAKALNCEKGVGSMPCGECVACRGIENGNFIDLIEVDAASRTKVDDTRELLDNVQYTPSQGRFKVYLIDEVHMLSTHSFNALLKTLEEPPAHVKFLLATTDPQKLPATILSRCIQFNLKALELEEITAQLEKILRAEELTYDQAALLILARAANGSVRDALSLLDQGIAFANGEVLGDSMRSMLGMIEEQFTFDLLEGISARDAQAALATIAQMAKRSANFASFLDELLAALHNIALCQIDAQAVRAKGVDVDALAPLAEKMNVELVQLLYQIALIGKRDLALAPDARSGFEMLTLRMLAFRPGAKADVQARNSTNTPASATANVSTNASAVSKSATSASSNVVQAESNSRNASSESKVAQSDEQFTLAQLAQPNHWANYVEQSGVASLTKELMMNMMPQSVDGNVLHFVIADGHGNLVNKKRLDAINKNLTERLGQAVQVKVASASADAPTDNTAQTPSQQREKRQHKKQQAAEDAFSQDPNVREAQELFGAEIKEDSIRPADS